MKTQSELEEVAGDIVDQAKEDEQSGEDSGEVVWELAKAHCLAHGWTAAEETALLGELGF